MYVGGGVGSEFSDAGNPSLSFMCNFLHLRPSLAVMSQTTYLEPTEGSCLSSV